MTAAWVALLLGIATLCVAWDVARRALQVRRCNQQTLDRLAAQERELERLNAQTQAVMGKLNAATAATATRTPRIVPR